MPIGNWYRIGTVQVVNGSANVVGTGTFWLSQTSAGDRFTVDGENWYEWTPVDDTHGTIQSVGGSGAFAGGSASNLAYAIDRNFTNNLNANIAASVASLVAQYQANSNGPLSGLFGNGAAATPGIAFLNEASTGLFHPATGIAALAVQGAEFLRAVGTAAGVPAMLGIGQTAPANAVDLLTTNNALYGARVVNNSTGTAARAAVQIGNGAQVLNVGVNGADFTTAGVLSASRGFVEGPTGVDFASGVTAGVAYSWGIGASYASQMTLDYQGNLAVATGAITATAGNIVATAGNVLVMAGKIGVGMTPANVVDVTKSQNAASAISLLNNSGGASASAQINLSNGSSSAGIFQFGTGWTTNGPYKQNGTTLQAAGAGGLTLNTSAAQPIYIGINNAQIAEFDILGNLLLGTSVSNERLTASGALASVGALVNAAGPKAAVDWNGGVGARLMAFGNTTGAMGPIAFYQASSNNSVNATSMTLDSSGDLLVGVTSGTCHTFAKSNTQGVMQVNIANTVAFYTCAGGGANAAATAAIVSQNTTNNRSINAAGTLNASGADYAEYRQLIASLHGGTAGAVSPGTLLGYDAAGLMTNVFANVVGRVLPKSTAPSYVGNDTWGTAAAIVAAYGIAVPGDAPSVVFEPVAPTVVAQPVDPIVVPDPGEDATPNEQAAYASYLSALAVYQGELPAYDAYLAAEAALPGLQGAYTQYQSDLAAYEARVAAFSAALETERVKWDRIALCGVVPVNVTGLTAADIGKYLVPCAAPDGTISATAVAKSDLTLAQYIDSFGSIEMVGSDGRPLVNVKNG